MNVFIPGPIRPTFISESKRKHQPWTTNGAHNICPGKVHADGIDVKTVLTIEYIHDVKSEGPIFGKQIFEDNAHIWKVNS